MKKGHVFLSFVQKHSMFVPIKKQKKANPCPIKLNSSPMSRKCFVKNQEF